jgi:hypothetical protein
MTTITALPTPPSRDDPTNFSARADAFHAALPTFATQTNAVASEVNANATTATTQAGIATTQADTATNAAASAISAANAVAWVSGTTYAIGNVVWSPANLQTYRRKTSGAGTTDPSSDSTNWAQVTALPSMAGAIGKFLTTDGSNASWSTPLRKGGSVVNSGVLLTSEIVNRQAAVNRSAMCQLSATKYLVAYSELTGTTMTAVVITKDAATGLFTRGPANALTAFDTRSMSLCPLTSTTALLVYRNHVNGNLLASVVSVSGNTVTLNAVSTIVASGDLPNICRISETSVLLSYQDASVGKFRTLDISGTSITANAAVNADGGGNAYNFDVELIDPTKFIAHWTTGSVAKVAIVTLSGTVPSVGTPVNLDATFPNSANGSLVVMSPTSVVGVYVTSSTYIRAVVLSISGTTITVNTPIQLAYGSGQCLAIGTSSTRVCAIVDDANTTTSMYGIDISGTTLTATSRNQIYPNGDYRIQETGRNNIVLDSGNIVFGSTMYGYDAFTYVGIASVAPPVSLTLTAASDVVLSVNATTDITLPDPTTLDEASNQFVIKNRGLGLAVYKSNGVLAGTLKTGSVASFSLVDQATNEWIVSNSDLVVAGSANDRITVIGESVLRNNFAYETGRLNNRIFHTWARPSDGNAYINCYDFSGTKVTKTETTLAPNTIYLTTVVGSKLLFNTGSTFRVGNILDDGRVVSIADTAVASTFDAGVSAVAISPTKAVFAHFLNSTSKPTIRTLDINQTSNVVTLNTAYTLDAVNNSVNTKNSLIVNMLTSSVGLFAFAGNDDILRFVPFTLAGDVFTVGAVQVAIPIGAVWDKAGNSQMIPLSSTSSFVLWRNSGSGRLAVMIVSTDGVSVTQTVPQFLDATFSAAQNVSVTKIDANRVCIMGSSGTNNSLAGTVQMLYINGTTLSNYGATSPAWNYALDNYTAYMGGQMMPNGKGIMVANNTGTAAKEVFLVG